MRLIHKVGLAISNCSQSTGLAQFIEELLTFSFVVILLALVVI